MCRTGRSDVYRRPDSEGSCAEEPLSTGLQLRAWRQGEDRL